MVLSVSLLFTTVYSKLEKDSLPNKIFTAVVLWIDLTTWKRLRILPKRR